MFQNSWSHSDTKPGRGRGLHRPRCPRCGPGPHLSRPRRRRLEGGRPAGAWAGVATSAAGQQPGHMRFESNYKRSFGNVKECSFKLEKLKSFVVPWFFGNSLAVIASVVFNLKSSSTQWPTGRRRARPGPGASANGTSTILSTISSNFVQFRAMCTKNCNSLNLSNVYNVINNIVHQIVLNLEQCFVQYYVQYWDMLWSILVTRLTNFMSNFGENLENNL